MHLLFTKFSQLVKFVRWCPTLCDPHGILWVRILEWVAVPFFKGSAQLKDHTQVSHIAGRFFTSQLQKKQY